MAKILIAEDDRDIRGLVVLALGYSGFEVIDVIDGSYAIEKATEEKYDCILLDVNMPHTNGYTACREIRQNGMNQDTPIFILSAAEQEEERIKGMDAGANGYILKPFAPSMLVKKINEIVGS